MAGRKSTFTTPHLCVLAVGLLLYLVVAAKLTIAQEPIWAMVALSFGAVIILRILLEMRATRIVKGFSFVAFGALTPVWVAIIFQDLTMSSIQASTLEVLAQMFALASAGAGGSIIAVHGEKTATDSDIATAPFRITSDTRRILELEIQSSRLASWIKTLCGLIALVTLGLFLNLLR